MNGEGELIKEHHTVRSFNSLDHPREMKHAVSCVVLDVLGGYGVPRNGHGSRTGVQTHRGPSHVI